MDSSTVHIEIVSDTVCPWCFVGKRQLERALRSLPDVRAQVRWRPYFLDPSVPRGGLDAREYTLKKFGHEGARRLGQRLQSAAEQAGVELHLERQRRRPNTLDCHRVIHWAQERGVQDGVVEALFEAYFQRGRDIGDRDVLSALAGTQDMDEDVVRARLETEDDTDVILAQVAESRDQGVTGVPCFFIEGMPIPGAQEPDLFTHVIQRILRRRQEPSSAIG